MTDQPRLTLRVSGLPRYALLLLVLCLLLVFAPTATATGSAVLVEVLFDVVLIVGAYSVTRNDVRRWPFLTLTAVAFITRWCALLWGEVELEIIAAAFTAIWTASVVMIILGELFGARGATGGAIIKSVVAYLLIAVVFGNLYELVELSQPGSFSGVSGVSDLDHLGDALLYFSLVTLTTVGYGDIVPVSSLVRPVVALEGALGTLYIAVIIARLVALHVAGGADSNDRFQSDAVPTHPMGN